METDFSDLSLIELQTPMFALIIGINKYSADRFKDLNLNAAVNDADAIDYILTTSMGVPPENIVNLRNEGATREAIINSLKSLVEQAAIKRDESAILIYFAGHGARSPVPPGHGWEHTETDDAMVEILCPADMGVEDSSGSVVQGIPDRTISVLLNNLSAAKGDNITLILDCCYSANIQRNHKDGDHDSIKLRTIPNPPKISSDCDRKIWEERARAGAVAEEKFDQHSHVLLAACRQDEVAVESGEHGAFTEALLDIFKEENINDLTYLSLMHKLKMPHFPPEYVQTPHCTGRHIHRRLFSKTGSPFILGRYAKDHDEHIILQAGAVQGVAPHSNFSVYGFNLVSDANPELGILEVVDVFSFESVLSFPPNSQHFHIPSVFYAKQTRCDHPQKEFKVYCTDGPWLESVLPTDFKEKRGIAVAKNIEAADMRLEVDDEHVFFDRRDNLMTPILGSRFPHRMNKDIAERIQRVLACAIHFNYHLTRTGPDFKNVWMEVHEFNSSSLTPRGANLIEDGLVDIIVDGQALYGLTIHNDSEYPLYPYLYWFEASDLEIMPWYLPPPGHTKAPLPKGGQLSGGHGNGTIGCWQFFLREGQDVDLGFIKLFLSTEPVDFSTLAQDSPFEFDRGKIEFPTRVDYEAWGIKTVTVVQRRYEVTSSGI